MTACTAVVSEIDDVALGVAPSAALATHLQTCAACAALLERRRALVGRIDRAVGAHIGAELPVGLSERIAARVAVQRPRRRMMWVGLPVAAALAAGLLLFISTFGSQFSPGHGANLEALGTWRSPTASLLLSRSAVLGAPFTLHDSPLGRSRS